MREASLADVTPAAGEPPRWLAETGLYADASVTSLAAGVVEYEPIASLWADGATKRRFVRLPDGARIDTSDLDAWSYPVGTRWWKEFALEGHKLETRLLEKRSAADGDFAMVAYLWNDQGTAAEAIPEGATNVGGTEHDVPSAAECGRCHGGVRDAILGFTAVQLAHAGPGLTLDTLAKEGRLTQNPTSSVDIPGDPVDRAALSYLHANCGHCHNENTVVGKRNGYVFWLDAGDLAAVSTTDAFRTATTDLARVPSLDDSAILLRMKFRGNGQMPPLGTEHPDDLGITAVRRWMERLQKTPDGGGRDD